SSGTAYTTASQASIIAEDYIDFSTTVMLTGDQGQGLNTTNTYPRDITLVAGGDLRLTTNPFSFSGVVAVREEAFISVGGTLNGMLIVTDACDGGPWTWPSCDPHYTGDNTISGNPTISYYCTMLPVTLGT